MKPFQFHDLLLVCGLFLFAGCLGPSLGGVNVALDSVKPAEDNKLAATMLYSNENIVAFGVARSDYTLYLNGRKVAQSRNENAVPLPKMDKIRQTVVLDLTDAAYLKELAASANAQAASYRLETHLLVLSGEEKIRIKVEQNGSVDLRPLAPAR